MRDKFLHGLVMWAGYVMFIFALYALLTPNDQTDDHDVKVIMLTDTLEVEVVKLEVIRDTVYIPVPILINPSVKDNSLDNYIIRRQIQKVIMNPKYYERNG